MTLRAIFWLALALIAASAAWRYRDALTGGTAPPPPSKPFEFDNGTLREYAPPASGGQAAAAAGTMRKCVRGNEVLYTNFACAAGYREKPIAADRVNVLPSVGAARPAVPPGAAPGVSAGPALLRDKLDLSQDARLREKAMERAVEAQSK